MVVISNHLQKFNNVAKYKARGDGVDYFGFHLITFQKSEFLIESKSAHLRFHP